MDPMGWSSRKVPWNTAAPNGRSVANWPGRALGSVEAGDGIAVEFQETPEI